jgi:hypothetical protein
MTDARDDARASRLGGLVAVGAASGAVGGPTSGALGATLASGGSGGGTTSGLGPELTADGLDPELLALPAPSPVARRLTLALVALSAMAALYMCWVLYPAARYAFADDRAEDLGELSLVAPSRLKSNAYVCATGLPSFAFATRYTRTFDDGLHLLAPVVGAQGVWIDVRVARPENDAHFVPPSRFCGRLVAASDTSVLDRPPTGAAGERAQWFLLADQAPRDAWPAALLLVLFAVGAVGMAASGRGVTRPKLHKAG